MAHRLDDEAGVTRALAIGLRMTPAEHAKGRFMRAPDGHDRSDAMEAALDSIVEEHLGGHDEEEEIPDGAQPAGDEADELDNPDDPDADPDKSLNDEDEEAAPQPIPAPISWAQDAKEIFEQLPPELQAKVADREAQREKAIQSATTAAAEAKRTASVEAQTALAQRQREYADQVEQFAVRFAPQPPNQTLAATDPAAYVQLKAQYDDEIAQHSQWVQHIEATRAEAQQRDAFALQHALQQDQMALAEKLGEDWTDPGKRQALLTDLEVVGAALGYSPEVQAQAGSTDILALKVAAEWKAKADKYDKLQLDRKTVVLATRTAPRVAKPGTAQGSNTRSARTRDAAWAGVKSTGGRSGEANAAFLESMGVNLD